MEESFQTENYFCQKCRKSFKWEKSLKLHNKLHHAEFLPCYKCTECSTTTTTPSNLQIHFRTQHKIERSLDEVKKLNNPFANSENGKSLFCSTKIEKQQQLTYSLLQYK